jgi:hypothetical protein
MKLMLLRIIGAAVLFLALNSVTQAADITLPAPLANYKYNPPAIFTLLEQRASVTPSDKISSRDIELYDLSNLLWAASGLNRQERGWVIPIASSSAPQPYWRLYAFIPRGVFLYNWRNNSLMLVNRSDSRASVLEQDLSAPAPLILVLVSDGFLLEDFHERTGGRYEKIDLGTLAAGAMSQNIFMACESMGMKTRNVFDLDNYESLAKNMSLSEEDRIICALPVWYEDKGR